MAGKELADKQRVAVTCVLHSNAAQPCSCFTAYFSCIQPAEGMHPGCACHDAMCLRCRLVGVARCRAHNFPLFGSGCLPAPVLWRLSTQRRI